MRMRYGTCMYTKGDEPGTLKAVWREDHMPPGETGTGIATGGPTDGSFGGCYRITYYGPDGSLDAELDLTIEEIGSSYSLTWQHDGRTACEGIGIAANGGIAVAYVPAG